MLFENYIYHFYSCLFWGTVRSDLASWPTPLILLSVSPSVICLGRHRVSFIHSHWCRSTWTLMYAHSHPLTRRHHVRGRLRRGRLRRLTILLLLVPILTASIQHPYGIHTASIQHPYSIRSASINKYRTWERWVVHDMGTLGRTRHNTIKTQTQTTQTPQQTNRSHRHSLSQTLIITDTRTHRL